MINVCKGKQSKKCVDPAVVIMAS